LILVKSIRTFHRAMLRPSFGQMEEPVSQKTGKCKNYEDEGRNMAQTLYRRVWGNRINHLH